MYLLIVVTMGGLDAPTTIAPLSTHLTLAECKDAEWAAFRANENKRTLFFCIEDTP